MSLSEAAAFGKHLSQKWWVWVVVGSILFLFMDACASAQLDSMQGDEAFRLLAHQSHVTYVVDEAPRGIDVSLDYVDTHQMQVS